MTNENRTTAVATRTGTDIVFGADGKLQFNNYAAVLDFTGQLVAAGMAPKGKTKEQCAICIAFGLPLGMDVLASIQNIAVINGMPCVWGDALVGLVMASGLLEDYRVEYLPSVKDCGAVKVTVKRKGIREPFVGMFSKHMAELAGLWGKQGPWTQYPVRMMLNRARAFAFRDGFADVLKGLKCAEEVIDIETADRAPNAPRVSPAPYERNDEKPEGAAKKPLTAGDLINGAAKKPSRRAKDAPAEPASVVADGEEDGETLDAEALDERLAAQVGTNGGEVETPAPTSEEVL